MTGPRDASAEAYHDVRAHEHGQLREFEQHFRDHGPCSRAMAGAALGYGANIYSARVNKLVKEKILIELPCKAPCEVTGHNVGQLVHRHRVTLDQLGVRPCEACQKESGMYDLNLICCAGRRVLDTPGDRAITAASFATRFGHDVDQLKLIANAIHRARLARRMAAGQRAAAANEEAV